MRNGVLAACVVFAASSAFGQQSGSGSAILGGIDCAETVVGHNVDEMIASAGGLDTLYELSLAQIAEYDRWMVEMEKVMNQGVREAEIQGLYEQGIAAREAEMELKEALECRMGERP